MLRHAALGCVLAVLGCSAPPPRPAATSADLAAWVDADDGAPARYSATLPRATTETALAARGPLTMGGDPPYPPARPVTLPTHDAPPPRPGRRARVDVSFQQADMVSAFQVLADSGRFNLVMQEGLSGKVSATMRGVDPYDALVAIAEANGAEVRFREGVVVVRKR